MWQLAISHPVPRIGRVLMFSLIKLADVSWESFYMLIFGSKIFAGSEWLFSNMRGNLKEFATLI